MVFTGDHIRDVILGIRERGLMPKIRGLLSGYLGDVAMGDIVLDLALEIKRANPEAVWCCDPVMGDTDSGIFVRPGIPEFMKANFLNGLADITTPNQFELELLSGRKMLSREDAVATARELFCSKGCKVVFVTSLRTPDIEADRIETLAVTADEAWTVSTPFLPQDPTPKGQGDVFASIAFGTYLQKKDPKLSLEHATATLFGLVKSSPLGSLDLPLIDDQKDILTPREWFTATKL